MCQPLSRLSPRISTHLSWKYHVHEQGFVQLSFGTKTYVNKSGDKGLLIVIALDENGEFVKFFAPLAFSYKEGPT